MKRIPLQLLLYAFLAFIIAVGCSTSEKVKTGDEGEVRDVITDSAAQKELSPEASKELQQLMADNRSKLSDLYVTQKHDLPEAFLQRDTTASNGSRDPFDGYRIQILTTRDVSLADSVSGEFRTWADSTIGGYTPRAYVFFKQPYYKVHVGDFRNRDKANTLSQLVKKKYPDAWVVHDRINPILTPADTTQITMQGKKKN